MIVQGLCRKCTEGWFDAHWHLYPDKITCPSCGSDKIVISTDEDYHDYSEEEDNEGTN